MLKQNLKNKARISKTRDLQKVYRLGKTIHANTLVLKYFLKRDLITSRLAFVVSKKVSKKAVVRNKIRRVLKEDFRLKYISQLPLADYVIMVKTAAAEASNSQLRDDLKLAVNRILRLSK